MNLDVDGCLQGRISSGGSDDLGPELSLKIEKPESAKLDVGLSSDVVGHQRRQVGELVDAVGHSRRQPVLSLVEEGHGVDADGLRNRGHPRRLHSTLRRTLSLSYKIEA